MARLLAYLHVYYHEQIPWFLEKLSHIGGCEWDLVVSWSVPSPESEKLIRAFKADVRFIQVENVGYDIWPFISVLRCVDLDAYDYILKLHTKNSSKKRSRINGLNLRGYRWRDLLVDALLGSPEQFRSVWETVNGDPEMGIACNAALVCPLTKGLPEDTDPLYAEMERIGLKTRDLRFCGGTMFLARTAPLRLIRDSDLTAASFSAAPVSHAYGSLAHIYERIITYMITAQGYKIYPIESHPAALRKVKIHALTQPVISWLFALERRGPERHKYLVIFGIPIKLKG